MLGCIRNFYFYFFHKKILYWPTGLSYLRMTKKQDKTNQKTKLMTMSKKNKQQLHTLKDDQVINTCNNTY